MARFSRCTTFLFVAGFLARSAYGQATAGASVTYNEDTGKYSIIDTVIGSGYVAVAHFVDTRHEQGWTYLDVVTNGSYPDKAQAYAAGLAEGYVTGDIIEQHYNNTVEGYCDGVEEYCKRLDDFLNKNFNVYVQGKINDLAATDPYWHQVELFIIQMNAIYDGKNSQPSKPSTYVTMKEGALMFNIGGDLEDIEVALNKPSKLRKGPLGSGSCSALIKLLPGNEDLYVAQDTWSTFQSMLRIIKRYDFSYSMVEGSKTRVPGKVTTFSSYPATIYSGDDFHIMSSGLVSLETTIGNSNPDLFKLITPEGSVLEGLRVVVANRLATDGSMWAQTFSRFNSGTYNNEWMIVDFNKFTPHERLKPGTLIVLEQLPGFIMYDDKTELLNERTYWASYNSPYFPEVFNMSGVQAMVDKFGDWFTYDKTPRALIFKRDHDNVMDLESMTRLMRYNDYKNDPLSRCKCSPPYSAESSISARSDLNPKNGTYPFGALGHRSHGGTDMKVTNYKMAMNGQNFLAQCGPTFENQPPFSWLTADFADDTPHYGHPDTFKFPPVATPFF